MISAKPKVGCAGKFIDINSHMSTATKQLKPPLFFIANRYEAASYKNGEHVIQGLSYEF
ncbi:hypothetical protein [Phnomibacter ginsenosidimutans]|uniref:hypothetical protein n=1 Tax=Phnomibacter ginsenosidimutans TaxID=2676868 RepID=UPI0018D21814|nr:hypothetical protein [Phnomibacter ginsenosidimutans]